MKQTCIKKYGGQSPFSNKNVQNKAKQTCLEKYGVENTLQSKEFRQKIQNTCLEKYGTIAPNLFGSNEYNKNIFNKYGVKNVSQSSIIRQRMEQNCMKKYGVKCYQQTEEGRKRLSEISKNTLNKKYNTYKKIIHLILLRQNNNLKNIQNKIFQMILNININQNFIHLIVISILKVQIYILK